MASGLRHHDMPLVRSKRPSNIRKAAERLVRPSRLARRRENHEALRFRHADTSDDQDLTLAAKQRDRLIDPGSAEEGAGAGQASDTRAVISLSRTARSPEPDDLIR